MAFGVPDINPLGARYDSNAFAVEQFGLREGMDMMQRVELLQALGSCGNLRSGFFLDAMLSLSEGRRLPILAMLGQVMSVSDRTECVKVRTR